MTKCKFKNFANRSQINLYRKLIYKSKKYMEDERVIQHLEVIHCNGFSDRLHLVARTLYFRLGVGISYRRYRTKRYKTAFREIVIPKTEACSGVEPRYAPNRTRR